MYLLSIIIYLSYSIFMVCNNTVAEKITAFFVVCCRKTFLFCFLWCFVGLFSFMVVFENACCFVSFLLLLSAFLLWFWCFVVCFVGAFAFLFLFEGVGGVYPCPRKWNFTRSALVPLSLRKFFNRLTYVIICDTLEI